MASSASTKYEAQPDTASVINDKINMSLAFKRDAIHVNCREQTLIDSIESNTQKHVSRSHLGLAFILRKVHVPR